MVGGGVDVQIEAQLYEVPTIYFISGDVVGEAVVFCFSDIEQKLNQYCTSTVLDFVTK